MAWGTVEIPEVFRKEKGEDLPPFDVRTGNPAYFLTMHLRLISSFCGHTAWADDRERQDEV